MVRTRAGESFPRRDEPAAALRRVAAGPVRKDKKRKGSSVPAPPPRVRPEREAAGNPTVVDTDALDCGVCFLPLKPAIFQGGGQAAACGEGAPTRRRRRRHRRVSFAAQPTRPGPPLQPGHPHPHPKPHPQAQHHPVSSPWRNRSTKHRPDLDLTPSSGMAPWCRTHRRPSKCNSGHVVCSPCRDKLNATGKCHLCGIATGGYLRCHTMESLLESIRVPCPHAINGCTARPAYYDLDMHRQVCLYAGYRCPGKGCSFASSVDALVDHFAGVHGWPRAVKMRAGTYETCRLHLRNGFNFLLADLITATANRQYLFLVNVVRRPFGRAISVAQICPHTAMDERGTSSKDMKFTLTYSRHVHRSSHEAGQSINYYQSSSFRVARTDPTNELPSPDGSFQFEVLDSVLGDDEKDAVKVGVRIDLCLS